MTKEEILKQLNTILQDVLDIDDLTLTNDTVADDVEGWDSLSHISLISSIEEHFQIKFTMKEILDFQNVGELVNSIMGHLSDKD